MDDKELTELAAKAAGITIKYNSIGTQDARCPWKPIEDDGDAFRLAVKLQIGVLANHDIKKAMAWAMGAGESREDLGDDPDAATRRAIVLTAARIGKGLVTPNGEVRGASLKGEASSSTVVLGAGGQKQEV